MRFRKNFYFLITSFLFLFLFWGCKKDTHNETKNEKSVDKKSEKLTIDDIASINYTDYALSDSAIKVTQDWSAFLEINKQIEILKQADLSFFKDDSAILTSTLTDLKNEIPDKLNETSIEVRLTSLETNFYKLEGSAVLNNLKKELLINSIRDVLLSHTNLIFQINRKLEKDAQRIEKPF